MRSVGNQCRETGFRFELGPLPVYFLPVYGLISYFIILLSYLFYLFSTCPIETIITKRKRLTFTQINWISLFCWSKGDLAWVKSTIRGKKNKMPKYLINFYFANFAYRKIPQQINDSEVVYKKCVLRMAFQSKVGRETDEELIRSTYALYVRITLMLLLSLSLLK